MSLGQESRWGCPSCGNIILLQQVLESNVAGSIYKFRGPTRCGCGRKGKFRLINFKPLNVTMFDSHEVSTVVVPHEVASDVQNYTQEQLRKMSEKQREKLKRHQSSERQAADAEEDELQVDEEYGDENFDVERSNKNNNTEEIK